MTTAQGDDEAYEPLRPLMQPYGATCSPRDFYWAVNQAFHSAEALHYDGIHAGMFAGSEPMWRRLTRALPDTGRLHVLDVGSGTGLVGVQLARVCPERIATMTLLDPNAEMLARASERARTWPFTVEPVQGDIGAVAGRTFDVLTVSSVLHHVVELPAFCRAAAALVRGGGALLQMQDPRRGAAEDPVLSRRTADAKERRRATRGAAEQVRRLGQRLLRAAGFGGRDPVADSANATLVAKKIVSRPLERRAIWAVTDFHVPGQPGGFGHGISVEDLGGWLGMERRDAFTYEFHGLAFTDLAPADRDSELRLFAADDAHGAVFGSAWRKPTGT
jgi:SAM-dependent methyltransferase